MLVQWKVNGLHVIPIIENSPAQNPENQTEDRLSAMPVPRNLILMPGVNEVDSKDWAIVRPSVKDLIKAGKLVELAFKQRSAPGRAASVAETLLQLAPADAVKTVAVMFNPKNLFAWRDAEGREEVRAAIVKRIEKLELPEPPTREKEVGPETDLSSPNPSAEIADELDVELDTPKSNRRTREAVEA